MQYTDFKHITVGGETFYEHTEITRQLGISRQTLYNWRNKGRIPEGGRLRGKVLFTAEELKEILAYALRVEPAGVSSAQLRLSLK